MTDANQPARPVRQAAAGNRPLADAAAASGTPDALTAAGARRQRVRFFLLDSGWNSAAAQVIHDNLGMITRFRTRMSFSCWPGNSPPR